MDSSGRVILALDTDSLDEACTWVERFQGRIELYKVGSQLFTRAGPRAVTEIKRRGGGVFLDLKYHDIPNTVGRAVAGAAALGATFLTVHTLGGGDMIRRAVESAKEESSRRGVPPPQVLAVTILTSLEESDLVQLGMPDDVDNCVMRLANLALQAGADGLVVSPREIRALREDLGHGICLVVPGIRAAQARVDDQKRVMSPEEALEAGADYIVMGRSLLNATDPLSLLDSLTERSGAREC